LPANGAGALVAVGGPNGILWVIDAVSQIFHGTQNALRQDAIGVAGRTGPGTGSSAANRATSTDCDTVQARDPAKPVPYCHDGARGSLSSSDVDSYTEGGR
jgi:hypothetical protein